MINIGDNEISAIYIGNNLCSAIYAGDVQIYPSTITGLRVSPSSITCEDSGGSYNINITSDRDWVITSSESWVTLSESAGTSGRTTIVATIAQYTGDENRTATITVETTDSVYTETVSVTQNTIDYSKKYLTFDILSSGYVNWMYNNNATTHNTIQYRKNGGSWSAITATSGGVHIDVVSGDVVEFKGDNATYSNNSARFGMFMGTTCSFNVKGNIMSLINSTNFQNLTSLSSSYNFRALFLNVTGLIDASNLVLPATTLATGCYRYMFQQCSSLTKAPTLSATTMVNECYMGMFNVCSSLNYIKCLAINRATNDTNGWVNGVSATGTFIKASSASWTTGIDGIPSGWTVQNA